MAASRISDTARDQPASGNRQATNLSALLVGMASVQIGASLATTLFAALGPAATGGLRVLLASLMLLPLAVAAARFGQLRRPTRRAWSAVLVYGATLGGMNVMFYLAVARLPLGIVVAIEFMGPLVLALLGSRRPRDLLWVLLAAGGLALLLQPWAIRHRLDPFGVLLAAGAGAAWALYILAGRRLGRHVSGVGATALGMGTAALLTLPLSLTTLPILFAHPVGLLPAALGMALLSSAVPYSIEMMVMQRMSMRGFSILMSLEPAIAALIGLLLLHEQLSPLRWLAIGGIIAASLGSALADVAPTAKLSLPAP